MSKLRSIPYAVLTVSLFAAGGASAQSMYGIDQRQDYQQDRIERGIRDGQITRSEAYRLEQGERSIDRAQARARADGVVTPQERARIDHMTDREGREIYQQSHDRQQSWDRGQSWGHSDGRNDGWRDNGGRQDGWGRNQGWDRDGDRGEHNGWTRGEHNGWDGNRPPGVERRDARDDQRIHDGVRDGSLTRGEANRLDRGQNRIDRYEARARSDGTVTPSEHNRIDNMQNRESQRIYNDRHNDRTASGTTDRHATRHGYAQREQWRLAQSAGVEHHADDRYAARRLAQLGQWRRPSTPGRQHDADQAELRPADSQHPGRLEWRDAGPAPAPGPDHSASCVQSGYPDADGDGRPDPHHELWRSERERRPSLSEQSDRCREGRRLGNELPACRCVVRSTRQP